MSAHDREKEEGGKANAVNREMVLNVGSKVGKYEVDGARSVQGERVTSEHLCAGRKGQTGRRATKEEREKLASAMQLTKKAALRIRLGYQ